MASHLKPFEKSEGFFVVWFFGDCENRGMYYVYVLENASGRLYIGHTNDVARRIEEHNSAEGKEHLGKYTHRNARGLC
ncbi:GIY-YIG nuclease family protein [Coraliomargarita sp. SDUM461004]|uniref:GIY-YIG nuclease family protein n=2 Tax=Thalassobacterium sedimentorum TaxID=3041258 RepID=A0ABU1AN24_9BACT|nr:GIY-YIG nuclease family protein [Coraliomargarita sp. SDUM461004]